MGEGQQSGELLESTDCWDGSTEVSELQEGGAAVSHGEVQVASW